MMKTLEFGLIVLSSVSLLSLGACGTNEQVASPDRSPAASTETTTATPEPTTAKTESTSEKAHIPQSSQGGQVVESGPYHLEFLSAKEEEGTHLDFYLQKGEAHEAVPNAEVTAQVQLPDGTQKTIPLTYDAQGKHYTALLPEITTGQYQIKVTSEINGEKVDGRFSFER